MSASPAALVPDTPAHTVDAFHRGRFWLVQPRQAGHRAGMDAMMLAASVPSSFAGRLADFGAGAGAAGSGGAVALSGHRGRARRTFAGNGRFRRNDACPSRQCASRRPRLAAHRRCHAVGPGANGRRPRRQFLRFRHHEPALQRRRGSRHARPAQKGSACHGGRAVRELDPKCGRGGQAARRACRHRPAANSSAPSSTRSSGRFGDAEMLAVHPRPDAAAIRIVVRAALGARGKLSIRPPLMLHAAIGRRPIGAHRDDQQRTGVAVRRLIHCGRPGSRHCRKPANSYMHCKPLTGDSHLVKRLFNRLLPKSWRSTRRHHSRHQAARHHHVRRRPVPAEPVAGFHRRPHRKGVFLRRAGGRHLDQFAGRLAGAVAADLQAHPRPGSRRRTRRCWSSSRTWRPRAAT